MEFGKLIRCLESLWIKPPNLDKFGKLSSKSVYPQQFSMFPSSPVEEAGRNHARPEFNSRCSICERWSFLVKGLGRL
jgi:hypothetical protein